MKLSDNTVSILKNFATINQSLQFKPGNVLRTISPLRTIFVEASVDETFPMEAAVYDLNELLSVTSVLKNSELEFGADALTIKGNNNVSSRSNYCSPKVIVVPPDKTISLGAPDCTFSLSQENLELMRKLAGISGSPNFIFESDGTSINFVATDVKDDASRQSKIQIGEGDGKAKFRVVMKVENFKMLDGAYDVSVAKKGLACFKHKTVNITYYIAIEAANSTFGEVE